MPLTRFTSRRLITAVVIVALLLKTERLLKRRAYFLGLAEAHGSRRYDYGEGRGFVCPNDQWYDGDVIKKEWWTYCDRVSDHSAALERKYRYAAAFPWLEVEPDPPWPEP
jgi:hypothetical protein